MIASHILWARNLGKEQLSGASIPCSNGRGREVVDGRASLEGPRWLHSHVSGVGWKVGFT